MAKQPVIDDKTMQALVQNMMGVEPKKRTTSEQEKVTAAILTVLDELGGRNVGEDALIFTGTKFILPETMSGDIQGVIKYLKKWDDQQNTETTFSREYNYRPFDGAAAFDRAMKRIFGTTGIGKAHEGFFSSSPPALRSIAAGAHGETLQVPWGAIEFSPLNAIFELGYTGSTEYGLIFEISCEAPRRHKRRIEGFFDVIADELREHSIYKGKVVTPDPIEPKFVDTTVVDPTQVIYKNEVATQLDVNLWAPIRYTDELRKNGIPLKRAVLLEGPNGTGKTLAGILTAQIAEMNGWTFIMCRPGDDPLEAINTAKMYAPAVVCIEDMDTFASAQSTRKRADISKVLDALDGARAKGSNVMVIFTTNFAETLDKAVVRAGRLDAVIHIAELDAAGYERLVRALVPGSLLDEYVDFAAVAEAYKGFLPAFAAEAAQLAVRYSIARNHGKATTITTADLVDAAYGMRDHLKLMEDAQHSGQRDSTTLDAKIAGLVHGALGDTTGKMKLDDGGDYKITFQNGAGV